MDAANGDRLRRPRSWLRSPMVWTTLLLLSVGGGIFAWVVCDPLGTDSNDKSDQPTKKELVAFLEGQTISTAGAGTGAGPPTLTLRRIEALEIEETSTVEAKTWSTRVSFIAQAGAGSSAAGRYAVTGAVRHRLIEGKRAFIGFKAKVVSQQ